VLENLTISTSSWHAKVFAWWNQEASYPYKLEAGSAINLCPYMRAVLIYAPLRWLYTTRAGYVTWPVTALIANAIAFAFEPHFRKNIFFLLESGFAGLFAFVFLMCSICWLVGKIWKSVTNTDAVSSFGELLYAGYKAGHDRFCPRIEVRGEEVHPDPRP